MRKTIKFLGIIVSAAIIALSFTSCGDSSGSGSAGTYTVFMDYGVSGEQWLTDFGSEPPTSITIFSFGTKSKSESLAWFNATDADKITGLKISDIEYFLLDYVSPAERNQITSRILSDGFSVVGIFFGEGKDIELLAAFKN